MKKALLLLVAALLCVGTSWADNGRRHHNSMAKKNPTHQVTKGPQAQKPVSHNNPKDGTPVALPYTCGFESAADLAAWTLIDQDGDGYNWTLSSSIQGEDFSEYAHSGNGFIFSQSYDNEEGELTPNNWLISPELVVPQGGATLSWWIAPQDEDWMEEHYKVVLSTTAGTTTTAFTTTLLEETLTNTTWAVRSVQLPAGNVRVAFVHYNCTDNYFLNLDDVAVIANNATQHTVTVTVDPEGTGTVSGAGSYPEGAWASLEATPAEGYYFQGWSNGSTENPLGVQVLADVTLTAHFATLPTCHYTLPYSYGFEDPIVNEYCWSMIDGNDDESVWTIYTDDPDYAHSGGGSVYSMSNIWGIFELNPIDYLISPELEIPEGGATLSWWVNSDQTDPIREDMMVMVSPTAGTDMEDFTDTIFIGSITNPGYQQLCATIELSGTVRVAFVHVGGNAAVSLDDVAVVAGTSDFTITVLSDNEEMGTVSGGGTYAAGAPVTLTATPNEGYLFLHWNDGNTQNPRTVAAAGDATYTAYFMEAPSCHYTLPYTEDFENAITANYCWQMLDEDGDGFNWFHSDAFPEAHSGSGIMASASYVNGLGPVNPDNWLISPEIEIPAEGATLAFWAQGYDASDYAEFFRVLVSPTAGTSPSDFQVVRELTMGSPNWTLFHVNIATPGTVRIAFQHTNCTDQYQLHIDDIEITAGQTTEGIDQVEEAEVLGVEYYDVLGRKLQKEPARGIYLIRTLTTQGASTRKIVKL